MHESILAVVAIVLGLVILGVSWLLYLANGGTPFRVTFRGLGIEVDIARPTDAGAHTRSSEKGHEEII